MDFLKESTKDMPKHGYDASLPTCWILEGLVNYLTQPEVLKLLDEITQLSPKGSYIILSFLNMDVKVDPKQAGSLDYMDASLKEKNWICDKVLFFGDAEFNYERYPNSEPSENLGFAFYSLK